MNLTTNHVAVGQRDRPEQRRDLESLNINDPDGNECECISPDPDYGGS
jgi:hypothetical protein